MVYDCGIIVGEVLTNKFKYKMENNLETKESKEYEVLVGDPKAVNWYSLPNSTPIVVSNDSIDGKRLVFGGNTIKVSSFIGKGQYRISNESGAMHIDTYLGYFGNQSADQSSNRFRSLADWRLQLDSVQLLVYT
ncbi:hypothetical protein BC833DRAFT_623621 [Globomyces pollinis-pini]|nr:hypothetical protein BC833DRAFT_623621 [Globomyces pollinis-pini]